MDTGHWYSHRVTVQCTEHTMISHTVNVESVLYSKLVRTQWHNNQQHHIAQTCVVSFSFSRAFTVHTQWHQLLRKNHNILTKFSNLDLHWNFEIYVLSKWINCSLCWWARCCSSAYRMQSNSRIVVRYSFSTQIYRWILWTRFCFVKLISFVWKSKAENEFSEIVFLSISIEKWKSVSVKTNIATKINM